TMGTLREVGHQSGMRFHDAMVQHEQGERSAAEKLASAEKRRDEVLKGFLAGEVAALEGATDRRAKVERATGTGRGRPPGAGGESARPSSARRYQGRRTGYHERKWRNLGAMTGAPIRPAEARVLSEAPTQPLPDTVKRAMQDYSLTDMLQLSPGFKNVSS